MKTMITLILVSILIGCTNTVPLSDDIEADTKRIILREESNHTENYRIFDLRLKDGYKPNHYVGSFVDIYGDQYEVISIKEGDLIKVNWVRVNHFDTLKLNSGEVFINGRKVK